jgi:mono/diheme cytochrome c family protein
MIRSIKIRRSLFSIAALLGLATFALARPVEAEPTYPPRLQAGLEKVFNQSFCVPQCIVCHQTNAGGGPTTAFGTNLVVASGRHGLKIGGVDDPIADVVEAYFADVAMAKTTGGMPNGDSDGDGISDEDELKAGDLPGVAGPAGQNLLCADIKYGCAGGRIAPAPPPADTLGLLSAGLVVVGFAAMRRRGRNSKRAR